MNYRERLKDKKRIVIKIGSSSLTHSETGRLNLRKLEVLARELSDLRNQGNRTERKTGMCSSRTGQTDDDLSETFF